MKNFQKGQTILFILFSFLLLNSCNTKNRSESKEDVIVVSNDVVEKPSTTQTSGSPQVEDLSGNVQFITEEQFFEKITELNSEKGLQYKGKTPAVVDFYADWCRPCIALNPVLDELAKKYKGQIIIYKVNVDKAQKLAAALGIQSIPTMFFFKPNTQPGKIVGAPSKIELEKTINDALL